MNEKQKEILGICIAGRNTLDKQEMMNNICDAFGVARVEVKITPGDVVRLGKQMIADA